MRETISAALVSGPVTADGSSLFEFRFPATEPTFAGHFPMRPILPGVFQLEMARLAAERVLNCALVLREVPKAKFLRPILPDEIVRLVLKVNNAAGVVQVRAHFSVAGRPAGETLLVLCQNG